MKKTILNIYNLEDIKENANTIKHQNAFIRPDGCFYLAKGSASCNPSQQLETSTLAIAKQDMGHDITNEYYRHLSKLKLSGNSITRLRHLRSILVHYYGYALFTRIKLMGRSYKREEYFYDESLVPNPLYYGKAITAEQIQTLQKLFELNDDGALWTCLGELNSEVILEKVLKHEQKNFWHY